jgi:hypothetical protein
MEVARLGCSYCIGRVNGRVTATDFDLVQLFLVTRCLSWCLAKDRGVERRQYVFINKPQVKAYTTNEARVGELVSVPSVGSKFVKTSRRRVLLNRLLKSQ